MSELCITENIIIDEWESVKSRIEEESGCIGIAADEVSGFINSEIYTKLFLDETLGTTEKSDRSCKYVWLDSGFVNVTGQPLLISLIKYPGEFVGHYVGTIGMLSQKAGGYKPKKFRQILENSKKIKAKYDQKIEKRGVKHLNEIHINEAPSVETYIDPEHDSNDTKIEIVEKTALAALIEEAGFKVNYEAVNEEKSEDAEMEVAEGNRVIETDIISARSNDNQNTYAGNISTTNNQPTGNARIEDQNKIMDITEEVFDQLMFNNWRNKAGLDRYVKIIGQRLKQLIAQKRTEFYILNNIKSAIVNTGLLNNFAKDILIMYRYHMKQDMYVPYQVINSKAQCLEEGFTREQATQSIAPISFLEKDEVPFHATLDDFDINYRSLVHVIEERRDRFPANLSNVSDSILATRINSALELGLKMQHRDSSYMKASYSTKTGTISWLMPLHINREFDEEPELVMAIRKNGMFYEIKTILPYDDVLKDKITALSLYSRVW